MGLKRAIQRKQAKRELLEIETFCLGCGTKGKAQVVRGDPVLKRYSVTPVPAWCEKPECQVKRQMFADVVDGTAKSLYKRLLEAGCELDHHESDLYVKVSEISSRILELYAPSSKLVTTFTSKVDGELWYDVPFAYEPHWQRGGGQEQQH